MVSIFDSMAAAAEEERVEQHQRTSLREGAPSGLARRERVALVRLVRLARVLAVPDISPILFLLFCLFVCSSSESSISLPPGFCD